ncbi:sigma-70 family RNA polymerase sigma factor [Peribacillus sp. SCS-26]|uniref:sigma-70 family RNA polymerase sigma factor n=1 Tax=Paraperibacillus marinus TaxID=3115295 RepID=UPI0039062FC5
MNEIELVKRAVRGDEQAFSALIKAQGEKLYKTAFLYVRNKEDALDVVQETAYKAFLSISGLKNPEYFGTWLIKILIRCSYTLLNKRKKSFLPGDDVINAFLDSADIPPQSCQDLPTALEKLEGNYRTVIILFYYHDWPIKSIAEAMEKPEGTVKTYLRRARLELKTILKEVPHEQMG